MWFFVACFGVRVSAMFHLMFVYGSSALAAEWEIASNSVGHLFSLSVVYLYFKLFPVLDFRV